MFTRTFRAIFIAALMIAGASSCNPAAAATPSFVYTETSAAGETLDAFAKRIAKRAVKESLVIGGEICGEFRIVGELVAMDFYTIHDQHRCSYLRVAGETYNRLTYHTHIFIGLANANAEREKIGNPKFSAADYSHPGYMTTGRIVLFQSGTPESVRKVR